MAARKTPSGGSRPDKVMRDALILELNEEIRVTEGPQKGQAFKKLRLVARSLVNAGIKGDVSAAKEIFDRVDGKVALKVGGDPDGVPVKHESALDDETKAAVSKLADYDPERLAKLTADELARLYAETAGEAAPDQGKPGASGSRGRAVSKRRKVPRK